MTKFMDYQGSTNPYIELRGTYEDIQGILQNRTPDTLRAWITDAHYNRFADGIADSEGYTQYHDTGKCLPYIGWYWRNIPFHSPTYIPIGDCGEFIGFMANNKWGYPERTLTEKEGEELISLFDEAIRISRKGGLLSEVRGELDEHLKEIWDFMESLRNVGDWSEGY